MAFQDDGTNVINDSRNLANIVNQDSWVDASLVEMVDDASFSPDGRVGTYAFLAGRVANWTYGAQGFGAAIAGNSFVDGNICVSDGTDANFDAISLDANVRSGTWRILGRMADVAATRAMTLCLRIA